MRVIMAVVSGYLTFAISAALLFQFTGQDPHATPGLAFGIGSVVWGMLFAALGGYMAARLVQPGSMAPSAWVGCLIAIGALASMYGQTRQGSLWSQLSALLLMAPSALVGGLINRRRPSSGTSATAPDPSSLP
jgi:peptidoglycan/LPS O-acetylase OafA/YrhL